MILDFNHLDYNLKIGFNSFIITSDNSLKQILAHILREFSIIITQMSQSSTKLFLLVVVLHHQLYHVWICEKLVSLI
jgi:hypothetical protein